LHYVLWDNKEKTWNLKLHTVLVYPTISKGDVKKLVVEKHHFALIDALPASYYATNHIPGALSIPYDEPVTKRKVREVLKRSGKQHDTHWQWTPIVIYCWNASCNASHILQEKINKLGVVNTWLYEEGLEKWA
jgi:3-mercaptopyruvate sulfurtransferase SseA